MGRILESLVRFFEEDDWRIQMVEHNGEPFITVGFEGKTARWTCYIQPMDKYEQFAFYSMCPLKCPPDRLLDVAEFICRANYGMMIGNFELDFRDGEIRYKSAIDVTDTELTNALIKPVVYSNCLMMDRYLPGIMAVIAETRSPEEACLLIETGAGIGREIDEDEGGEPSDDDESDDILH